MKISINLTSLERRRNPMLDWDDNFDYKKWFEKVKNMSEE